MPLPRIDYSGEPRVATLISPVGEAKISRRRRTRRVFATVTATWAMSPTEYAAFRTFFETTLGMGTASFKLELRYPLNSALTFWAVRFVAGYQVAHDDRTRIITAQLDLVQPYALPAVAFGPVPEGFEAFMVEETDTSSGGDFEEFHTADSGLLLVEE